MSIVINARGTSVPYFTIGKNGTTLYQGISDPSLTYTLKTGDIWFNGLTGSIEVWSAYNTAWSAPQLGNIDFAGSTITAGASSDLVLKTTSGNRVVLDAGAGDPTLSAPAGQNLYVSDSIGGSLYFNSQKWPVADGTANQVLTTDGTGNLSWASVSAGNLSGATLASGVLNSSLTSVGTLSNLSVSGVTTTGSIRLSVTTKTSNYTLTSTDSAVLVNGTYTMTLPSATTAGSGANYRIKNIGTGTVTVVSTSGTIDNDTTVELSVQYDSITVISDGSNWWLI